PSWSCRMIRMTVRAKGGALIEGAATSSWPVSDAVAGVCAGASGAASMRSAASAKTAATSIAASIAAGSLRQVADMSPSSSSAQPVQITGLAARQALQSDYWPGCSRPLIGGARYRRLRRASITSEIDVGGGVGQKSVRGGGATGAGQNFVRNLH